MWDKTFFIIDISYIKNQIEDPSNTDIYIYNIDAKASDIIKL